MATRIHVTMKKLIQPLWAHLFVCFLVVYLLAHFTFCIKWKCMWEIPEPHLLNSGHSVRGSYSFLCFWLFWLLLIIRSCRGSTNHCEFHPSKAVHWFCLLMRLLDLTEFICFVIPQHLSVSFHVIFYPPDFLELNPPPTFIDFIKSFSTMSH